MIAFCHSPELADGYDRLAAVAESVNAIGPVRWAPLGELARSNYMTRSDDGERARVKLFARRARVTIPQHVSEVIVELPRACVPVGERRIACGDRWYELAKTPDGTVSEPILVRRGQPAEIRRESRPITNLVPGDSRRPRGHVIVRRAATEIRDRVEPLGRRSGLAPALSRVEDAVRARQRSPAAISSSQPSVRDRRAS